MQSPYSRGNTQRRSDVEKTLRKTLEVHGDGTREFADAIVDAIEELHARVAALEQLPKRDALQAELARFEEFTDEDKAEVEAYLGQFRPPPFERRVLCDLVGGRLRRVKETIDPGNDPRN